MLNPPQGVGEKSNCSSSPTDVTADIFNQNLRNIPFVKEPTNIFSLEPLQLAV